MLCQIKAENALFLSQPIKMLYNFTYTVRLCSLSFLTSPVICLVHMQRYDCHQIFRDHILFPVLHLYIIMNSILFVISKYPELFFVIGTSGHFDCRRFTMTVHLW